MEFKRNYYRKNEVYFSRIAAMTAPSATAATAATIKLSILPKVLLVNETKAHHVYYTCGCVRVGVCVFVCCEKSRFSSSGCVGSCSCYE